MNTRKGYLVNDFPGVLGTIGLGFQLFIACFMATVLVPAIVGMDPSVTLLASGLGTLVALRVNKYRIPLYYGSSFATIAAAKAIMDQVGGGVEGIRVVQAGIVCAAVLEILLGVGINRGGKKYIDRLLPPVVTGPVAMIIAFGLAVVAVNDISGISDGIKGGSFTYWVLGGLTILIIALWATVLGNKGLIGKLSILGGIALASVIAYFVGVVKVPTGPIDIVQIPPVSLPNFFHVLVFMSAILMSTTVIAQVPESVAHLFQINVISQAIGKGMGRRTDDISQLVGDNLKSDGASDLVCGLIGGSMGTNYGETGTHSMLSGSVSKYQVIAAALFAIVVSFSGHVAAAIQMIPTPVKGGAEVLLFSCFGLVGAAILLSLGDRLLEAKNAIVAGAILLLGIAGGNGWGGSLPIPLGQDLAYFFPAGVPAMALAAIVGIVLNLVLPEPATTK